MRVALAQYCSYLLDICCEITLLLVIKALYIKNSYSIPESFVDDIDFLINTKYSPENVRFLKIKIKICLNTNVIAL